MEVYCSRHSAGSQDVNTKLHFQMIQNNEEPFQKYPQAKNKLKYDTRNKNCIPTYNLVLCIPIKTYNFGIRFLHHSPHKNCKFAMESSWCMNASSIYELADEVVYLIWVESLDLSACLFSKNLTLTNNIDLKCDLLPIIFCVGNFVSQTQRLWRKIQQVRIFN